MQPITNIEQLEAALRRPRAMLFIYHAWSAYSAWSRKAVQAKLEANPLLRSQIDWLVIDATEEDNELSKYVDAWLKTQEVDHRVRSGFGAILAIREERIVGTVAHVAEQREQFEALLNQLQFDS